MSDAELLATGIVNQSTIDWYHAVDVGIDTGLIMIVVVILIYVGRKIYLSRRHGKR